MVKKERFLTHKKPIERFSRVFFMLLIVTLTSISLISGANWDNQKNYDLDKREITIRNAFGLGEELFRAQLISPDVVRVVDLGDNVLQKVGEIKITNMNKQDFKNAFGKVDVYKKADMRKQDRKVVYKYRINIGGYQVPISESNGDGTSRIIGYETIYRYDWKEFNNFNQLPEGEIIIGVFIDVYPTETGEWIPTFFGKEISEWAVWTTDLNENIKSFWTLNASNNLDSVGGRFNGTSQGASTVSNGLIDSALEFNSDVDYMNITEGLSMWNSTSKNLTLSLWFNVSNVGLENDDFLWSYAKADGSVDISMFQTSGQLRLRGCGSSPTFVLDTGINLTKNSLNEFTHLVIQITEDGTGQARVWNNATLISTDNTVTDCDTLVAESHSFGDREIGTGEAMLGIIDEIGWWDRYLTQSEIESLYNNGAGITYDPIPPILATLSTPANGTSFFINDDIDFVVDTSSPTSLVNVTLYINGVANETINISGFSNTTTFTKNFASQSQGLYNWSAEVWDNVDNNLSGSRDFILDPVKVINETFNNITTEGATETFIINFTKISSLQVSAVNLIHNGTLSSFPYSVDGDNTTAEGSVVMPSQTTETNVSFFWNIVFSDSTEFNTSVNNQTIQILNMDDCSSFTTLIYNFTQLDESTQTSLLNNNSLDIQVNLYDLEKTTNLINFSQNFTSVNPIQICLESSILETVNYSSYVVVKYSGNESGTNQTYTTEYYNILNQTIGNGTVPKLINLYSLKNQENTAFRLTFRDSQFNLAQNILVQIHRKYVEDNDFKIVEIPLTDSNGQTILNLVRNTIIYNFIMVDESNNIIATFNSLKVFCQDFTIGECTINLNAPPDIEDVYNRDNDFGISITNLTYINASKDVSLQFVTNDLLPKTVNMNVFRNNAFGNRSVNSCSLTSASGLLTCDVSSITDSDQFLFVDIYVDGEFFSTDSVSLNPDNLGFRTADGAFYAFLLILFLITMFMEDRKILLISLALGWVVVLSLGLIKGTLLGVGSAGIWLLVSIFIFIWKLNKEESQ